MLAVLSLVITVWVALFLLGAAVQIVAGLCETLGLHKLLAMKLW